MAELLGVVLAHAEHVLRDAEVDVPAQALLTPVLEPLGALVGRHEELHLHLLELARTEDEVAGRDLVAERLADLGDPERRLFPGELQDILEVDEDPLGRFGAQVDGRALLGDRAHVRLEHEVELARLGQLPAADRAAKLAFGLHLAQMVLAEALLALAQALDERVAEALQVAGRLPSLRVHQDRGVQRDDVVALLDHRARPLGLDVVLQQDAVVAVVVRRGQSAVDLGRLEDEAAPLAERHDLVHRHDVGHAWNRTWGVWIAACR